jgi:hypothetical protein
MQWCLVVRTHEADLGESRVAGRNQRGAPMITIFMIDVL